MEKNIQTKYFLLIILICSSFLVKAQNSITWDTIKDISINTYSNLHPRITLDGKGYPMVIWGKNSNKSVYFSRWDGSSFSVPIKLNPAGMEIATAGWMGPDIASKGDTVYVVMKRIPETSDTNYVYIVRSFDAGVNFSAPVRVDFIADSLSRFPTLTVDDTGNPIVAFMKFNSSFLESKWVVAKSNDYGDTFLPDIKVSGWSGVDAEVCDCCPGAIVSSGDYTAMLYRDNLTNIRDIWTGISTDNSNTYEFGFNTENLQWSIMSCPASGPDAVIIGDTLYTTFLSGAEGSYRTYYSKSSVSTGEVFSVLPLTGNITGLSQQNYPRIATDGNAMAVVWKQNVSGVTQLPIVLTTDISNGFVDYEIVDLTFVTNTDVAVSNGNVFVVWQDDNSQTVKYRFGTYSSSTTSINSSERSLFTLYPNPFTSSVNMNLNSDFENSEIKIFNLLGEAVFSQKNNNSTKLILNLEDLRNGIYFLQVSNDKNSFVQKIIKE